MRAVIIILICLRVSPMIFGSVEKNETTFVPTREWQVVKKGTPIPKGLHVRHNFETGVTEAKLLDSDDGDEKDSEGISTGSQSKSLTLHPEKAVLESDENDVSKKTEKPEILNYTVKELMARLEKIKEEEAETTSELKDENAQGPKQKFRDYETLKKEMKSLNINITTDSELLTNYLQKFQSHKNAIATGTLTALEIKDILDILYNLEYLLHHIDNARVFSDMQGMTKVISPCLNGTNNEIKAEALLLLGAAVQSNPKVQAKALESDFVQRLLHILSTSNKIEVRSRCLYALSALIRQFPMAQKAWIDHGGIEIFGQILINDQLQAQIKVMKLINDLILERQNVQKLTNVEQLRQQAKAYAATGIEQKLLVHEYCVHLCNLMTRSFKSVLDNQFRTDNYEFLEVISESMITLAPVCKSHFRTNRDSLLSVIQHLFTFYRNLDVNDDEDENEVLKSLMLLIGKLETTLSGVAHHEL